ncbi:tRNA lysidine(34) synthetase TilS [Baaleninema simplex]|uniref:tRNA lysidine(34) synthetase TilS n=1 Tax=Baaleninema simplex TaxID=2862350 RepID=UPI0003677C15|nr:tRNA lysidine(34) synthetase TilS [Baaleninema simplex]
MDVWTSLHARVHGTLRQRRLLPERQRLLVAVSGGQDSLCLAQLLLDLQPKWGWHLAIAHCDHRWRDDSAANANGVERLTRAWNLPFYRAVATENLPSEAAARQWRYDELSQIASRENCTAVVTGHTQSDRAETLLYNLIRGAGADGLQALGWSRELTEGVSLVRPLLEVSRDETGIFCRERDLPVWEDVTNQNLKHARNRIRLELLPYLKQQFNPSVEASLAKTAELLRADVAYLERQAEILLRLAIVPPDDDSDGRFHLRLHRRPLKAAPLTLRRRAMRQFLTSHLEIAPTFAHIEKLTALIEAPNRSQTDPFPGGAIAYVERPWIYWSQPPQAEADSSINPEIDSCS